MNYRPEHWQNITQSSKVDIDSFYYEPPFGWHVCNDKINSEMGRDHPTSAVSTLQFLSDFSTHRHNSYDPPHILENRSIVSDHIRVLLYSGEFDLNCNTLGTLHTLEANYWRHQAWEMANRSLWKYPEDVAGEYFTMNDIFSLLIVRNSGHLLPMDLPATALDMITRFINDRTFADILLPSEISYRIPDHHVAISSNSEANTLNGDSDSAMGMVVMILAATTILGLLLYKKWYKNRMDVAYNSVGVAHGEECRPLQDGRYYQSLTTAEESL